MVPTPLLAPPPAVAALASLTEEIVSQLLGIVTFTSPSYALAVWVFAAFGLPFVGFDWIEEAVITRVFLFLGAVWYGAVTTIPLFIAMVFYYYPG